MLEDFFIPLIAIGLAELGDKTQISILLLSSKSKKHVQILLGVILAFLIVDGLAILLGNWITTLIDIQILKIVSGMVFIFFGIYMLLHRDKQENDGKYYKNPFLTSFLLIMLTEWGDKTQIAAALFAIKFNPVLVFAGTLCSLTILSLMAIFFGKIIAEKLNQKIINIVAGILFIILGIIFFIL